MREALDVGAISSRFVVYADRRMSVSEAACLMREHHVGSVVVVQDSPEGRIPVGILTDRDIVVVVAVAAQDLDVRSITVNDVMSESLHTVREHESVTDALATMRRHGVRRLPVVTDDGVLIGIVALDDLLRTVADELRAIVHVIDDERQREQRARP